MKLVAPLKTVFVWETLSSAIFFTTASAPAVSMSFSQQLLLTVTFNHNNNNNNKKNDATLQNYMPSDCFIFQLYTLWQFHHWGLLLLTQGVGHIGFPLRALLVGSNHSESGKPKEKFILTDGVTEYPRVLPDNSKSRSLDMWNKQFRGDFLARRLYIIRLWSWTAQFFLAAEAWQVYCLQHNLILGVSIRWCSSCEGLSLTRRNPINADEEKLRKRRKCHRKIFGQARGYVERLRQR